MPSPIDDTEPELIADLLAYLEAVEAEANRVPPYYPPGARLERVRVRVRVVAERQKFEMAQVREREHARLQGLQDDSVQYAYSHRYATNGGEDRQDTTRILDWDTEVRNTIRRGVVVGAPGLGKTWLLKWKGGRCAAQASQQIRDNGDLRSIVVPVYLRLTDVADALETLTERRKHGTADMWTPKPGNLVGKKSLSYWQAVLTTRFRYLSS